MKQKGYPDKEPAVFAVRWVQATDEKKAWPSFPRVHVGLRYRLMAQRDSHRSTSGPKYMHLRVQGPLGLGMLARISRGGRNSIQKQEYDHVCCSLDMPRSMFISFPGITLSPKPL